MGVTVNIVIDEIIFAIMDKFGLNEFDNNRAHQKNVIYKVE